MEATTKTNHTRRDWIRAGIISAIIIAVAGGLIYWQQTSRQVYIDTASIEAPEIDLAPSSAGVLQEIYVQVGDEVNANTPVAQVGNELITTQVAGDIISINDKVGAQVSPGQSVVSMIDPTQLRVVGKIDEDKGLSRIAVGEPVTFTVDAFGSKQYSGVIDEVSPTSAQSGIVLKISDTRTAQQFDVKARFDTNLYPELKNGMSARMWVYTQ